MKVKDFNLARTLECGQCFNYEKIEDQNYIVKACGKVLHISQKDDELFFLNASEDDINNIWTNYFDLNRDYNLINKALIKAEPRFREIIEKYSGIRILNQEFTEALISFVISQNNNIPRIKKNVSDLCHGGCFPSLEELSEKKEEDFRKIGVGFRAPYIVNAINFLKSCDEKKLRESSFEEAKAELMTIKGVGDKVANCVLLFSLGFRDAFPVDVWIKRAMEQMYFGKETDKKTIETFARDKFGKYGGYAQQYIFMYIREKTKITYTESATIN